MKKSQMALEFMMTYGWAIMASLIVIGVLAYIGFGGTGKTGPEKCLFGTGLSCLGVQLNNSQAIIVLRNALGQTLYDLRANFSDNSRNCTILPNPCRDDTLLNITCNTTSMVGANKAKLRLTVYYKKSPTGYDQIIQGEVNANVQS